MHSPAMIVVSSRIDDLLAEAAANRLAATANGATRETRFARALAGIRSLFGASGEPVALPRLSDLPHRG